MPSALSPQSINPATEQVLRTFDYHTPGQVDAILDRAVADFRAWRAMSFKQRSDCLLKIAAELRKQKASLAHTVTSEMGKPIADAEAEVEKCAWVCEYSAENAERFLRDQPAQTNATETYVSFLPLGVIAAVMPWNFPVWQVFRMGAPTMMAGNSILLKHAPNVLETAFSIEKMVQAAGLPEGVFQNLVLPPEQFDELLEDTRIAGVTLTGSPAAGSAVAAAAGRNLKKSVLELGGSDPFVVLADADLDAAVEAGVRARYANAGQVCLAPKRFILVDAVADEFEKKMTAAVANLRVGDPLDRKTQMGPMARRDLRESLDRQVQSSIQAGARLVQGGKPREGRGYFYGPTILADVKPEMAAFREETFGPVAALIRASDAERALELANNSDYGLSGEIWTRDLSVARDLARRMEVGGVFINGAAASDPRVPIGGVKRSGYGRELAAFGMREFVNIQTVWIGPAMPSAAAPSTGRAD
jgi:acyl-CoA reductase-like NAD-dependent aldehyde dehydrogenase